MKSKNSTRKNQPVSLPPSWKAAETGEYRQNLLAWYDREKRPLPWRRNPSLYQTVLSEFMLQQTQVATALPYFTRWLKLFPTLQDLARAEEVAVLKAWEGLGYYSRARNLHKLAKTLDSLDTIPRDPQSWLAMPGIGPYTAAAITSLEFGVPTAVVDGNVIRVLTRLVADGTEYRDGPSAAKALKPLADELLAPERPGDYNQAVMELGATVCRPKAPLCTVCPLVTGCRAAGQGNPERYPNRRKKKVQQVTTFRAWIRDEGGRILLHKIPDTARRLAGQHQLPEIRVITQGPQPRLLLEKKRGISNQRITEKILQVDYRAFQEETSLTPAELHWVFPDELEQVVMNGPHRRWIHELLESSHPSQHSKNR